MNDNINMTEPFTDFLKNIYKKDSYLDKYGGSLIAMIFTLFIFFIIFSYFYVMNKIKPIQKNWLKERCNPSVLPFAGLIHNPGNMSSFDFTMSNFSMCINQTIEAIVSYFVTPLYSLTSLITKVFEMVVKALQLVRKMFKAIQKRILIILKLIMFKLYNVMLPFQKMIMAIKDAFAKLTGILVSMFYVAISAMYGIKAFLGSFLTIVIIVLVALASGIVSIWLLVGALSWASGVMLASIFPPLWVAGTALAATAKAQAITAGIMTFIFIAASIPTALVAAWVQGIIDYAGEPVPGVPGRDTCFDEDTELIIKGEKTKIKNVRCGDYDNGGSTINATFKVLYNNQDMYKLNGVIVTGTHKVYCKSFRRWVKVKYHPESVLIERYDKPYLYCLNTNTNLLRINNMLFHDWDEIEKEDLLMLKKLGFISKDGFRREIHEKLDSGFQGETKVVMGNGEKKNIKDIKINDVLKNNNRVMGLVKILAKNLKVKKYIIKNKAIIGGPNLMIDDKCLGKFSTLIHEHVKVDNVDFLYHLITDNFKLEIEDTTFEDYYATLENIIDFRDEIKELKIM